MSIARHTVTLVLVSVCAAGVARAQSQRLALAPEAQALSELLHAVVPELRDSTAQLQLSRTDSGWRFRIEPSRPDRRLEAPAEGEAETFKGRLSRLTIRHAPKTTVIRRGGDGSSGQRAAAGPTRATNDQPDSQSVIRTRLAAAATATSGKQEPALDSDPASRRNAPEKAERVDLAQAVTASDALEFAAAGLRTALGDFNPDTATFSTSPSGSVEWRFEIDASKGGASSHYRLEFDSVTGRLVSIEGR